MSMRKIYKQIAKKHGVTVAEVRADIQSAITAAYTEPSSDNEITKAYQNRIPRKGEIPTPEEFIHYVTKVTKNKMAKT